MTAGGTGSPQGGQVGWDPDLNVQPIPPSKDGSTAAGDIFMSTDQTTQTNVDYDEESTDPADQPNFGLPESVTTKASRGESNLPEEDTEEQPPLTVEEQMQGGTDEQLEQRSPAALAERDRERSQAAAQSVKASAQSSKQARQKSGQSHESYQKNQSAKAQEKSTPEA